MIRAAVVVLVVAAACGCAGKAAPRETLSHAGALLFNGHSNDKVNCYTCHDGDAGGTFRAPNLAERVPQKNDDDLYRAIHDGPGMMPSFRGTMEDREIGEIISWLREKFPAKKG